MIKNYMKILWLGLFLIAAGVQAEDKMVFSDPLKTIVVKKSNPVFNIILQSNPTTGYSWSLKGYDSKLVAPMSHKFYAPKNTKMVGVPGYERWTFRVKPEGFIVPQITSISLIYLRPWDEQGAQVINFKVVTINAD
jgi:inhibitor of cysteine peptidase